jgi:8-oxo-dGTP diphosphatase
MNIRIISRVVVYDQENKKILLAKNKGANFWYPPGGGWEYEHENILECGVREIKEEAGVDIEIGRLLYVQEFHATPDTIFLETFWLGAPLKNQDLLKSHADLDPNGQVEMVKWFDKGSLQELTVFPKRLKDAFWKNVGGATSEEDPFIGVS